MSNHWRFLWLFPVLLTACIQPTPLKPVVNSAFVASGSTTVTVRGRDLQAIAAMLAGQTATITQRSATFDAIQLQVPQPLQSGNFTLQMQFDGAATVTQDVFVLPSSADVLAADLATERNKYLLRGAGFLAIPPSVSQTTLDSALSGAGFSSVGLVEPEPGADGVCANRFVSVQDTQIARDTLEGLNALNNQLRQSLPDNVDFELNAKLMSNQPDGTGSPTQSARVTPQALPGGLSSVRIAVLDSGISLNPAFGNAIDFVAARNFTAEDDPSNLEPLLTDVSDLAKDASTSAVVGHGTAVAGVVLQTLRTAIGFDNVLTNGAASIVPVKVCEGGNGRCSSSSAVAGVCYATSLAGTARPVKVINLSLGGELPSNLLRRALEHAASKGISIVTSAGNKGTVASRPVNFPAQYSVASGTPAIAGLLAVGSVNAAVSPSAFSSQGDWVSLTALGEDISAPSTTGGQAIFNGTSFSAPRVAAAALLLHAQAAPAAITPAAVKTKLITSVKVIPCSSQLCGAGLLDVTKSLLP